MKLIHRFLFSILLLFANSTIAQSSENQHTNNVGDIKFDPKIDDPNFKICNKNESFQYYNFSKGFQYKGEKYEILKIWDEKYSKVESCSKENGYITVKFLINCEGKTGLFRIQEMDEYYNESLFNKELVYDIFSFVKNLDGWIINTYEGKTVDYYQYLTFKIENGKVKEILP